MRQSKDTRPPQPKSKARAKLDNDTFHNLKALMGTSASFTVSAPKDAVGREKAFGRGSGDPTIRISEDRPELISYIRPRRGPGRSKEIETAAVVEAEAQRLFKERTIGTKISQRKVSQGFFPTLTRDQRYNTYRTRVHDHKKKIQTRLNELISQ